MSALPESRGPWALPVAVWRLLFLLCLVGSLLLLFALQPGNAAFDDRIIGIATIANSDVYHRIFTYILALVGFIALACVLFLGWQLRVFMGGTSCREREFLLAACLALQGTTIMFAAWKQGTASRVSRAYAGLLMWVFSAPLLYVAVIEIRAMGWPGEAAPSPYRVFALLSLVAVVLGATLRDRGRFV